MLVHFTADAEAAKQKEHAFSFTSVSSRAYAEKPGTKINLFFLFNLLFRF